MLCNAENMSRILLLMRGENKLPICIETFARTDDSQHVSEIQALSIVDA